MNCFAVRTARGDCPYVGVPVFLSRTFRHTSIYVRRDRVKQPADLKGKKAGITTFGST
jgi:4,5-dihydroxyphthalate decarboxylase